MKNFFGKFIRIFFITLIPTLASVITIFIAFCKGFEKGLNSLGINGLVISVLSCVIIAFIISEIITRKNSDSNYSCSKNNVDIINNIFKMAYIALKYPYGSPDINIHFYLYNKSEEGEFLIKQRNYNFESESLSVDYSFDKCKIDSSNIVMCKAYRNNCIVFESLPDNHVEMYDMDVKKHIDRNIKWVLAGPVWKNNNPATPIGVIVVFGLKPIADNNQFLNENLLKSFCLELSKSISGLIINR